MKFRFSYIYAALYVSSGSAWSFSPTSIRNYNSQRTRRWVSTSAAAAIEEESSMSTDTDKLEDKTIAEGAVVSKFPGGLMAIRLKDGNDITGTSVVLGLNKSKDATEGNKKKKGSTSTGGYQGKKVIFPDGSSGVVVAHRPPLIFCYGDIMPEIQDGVVQLKKIPFRIPIPSCESGHKSSAVDYLGRTSVAENKNVNYKNPKEHAMFAPIPGVADIALINHPVLSGITMLDTLAPIGQGQNMLLVGHDLDQMRLMVTDLLQTQCSLGTTCVYASNESDRKIALSRLEKANLADKVYFVGTKEEKLSDNDQASSSAEAVAIASTACSIAESYAKEGRNTLVVIDTIDLHKKFWDATTRVLVDVFGVDAVVQADRDGGASSEMRGFYSSLVQRSAQFNAKKGGGSVTLLLLMTIPPIVRSDNEEETVFQPRDFEQTSAKVKERIDLLVKRNISLTAENLRKINVPVPSASEGERRLVLQHVDDLISMSDGQIWLDERLEDLGQQPPMDPQRSVTRIGIGADTQSRADAPALRRIAEGLRLDLSQAASMDGAEATDASLKQIRRQRALLLAMHQKPGEGGRKLSESCVALFAAKEGLLDDAVESGALAGTKEGEKVMQNLLSHMKSEASGIMNEIDESLDISKNLRPQLREAISSFFKKP